MLPQTLKLAAAAMALVTCTRTYALSPAPAPTAAPRTSAPESRVAEADDPKPAPLSSTPSVAPLEERTLAELPNFHKVDDHLYRGGQPGRGGIAKLKALGIRTVINLRYEQKLLEAEGDEARRAGLGYFSVPMYGLVRPTDEQMARVLQLIETEQNWPVFVHCRRGSDRTGAVVACYRVSHAKWTAERAIREAYAYGMLWLERAKRTFVRDFYAKVLAEAKTAPSGPAGPASPALFPSAPALQAA